MSAEFEHYNDDDELWLSDLETRAIDLENDLVDLREYRARELADSRARERAESVYRREAMPGPARAAFRRAGEVTPEPDNGRGAAVHTAARTASSPVPSEPEVRPYSADERTRKNVSGSRSTRALKIETVINVIRSKPWKSHCGNRTVPITSG